MSDIEINKIIDKLIQCPLSSYEIAKNTGITNQSIINYRSKKTKPTKANAQLLEYFLNSYLSGNFSKNSENTNVGSGVQVNASTTGNIANGNQGEAIEVLREQLNAKDAQIKELIDVIKALSGVKKL